MASANVLTFDDGNFDSEVLKATGTVMVDFTATWCGPCRQLAPIIDKIADQYAGKLKVGKVDIDACPALASRYGVKSVPTVMVFRAGEKVASHIGLTKQDKLVELAGV